MMLDRKIEIEFARIYVRPLTLDTFAPLLVSEVESKASFTPKALLV